MKSYKHFSIIEREILLILHELGLSTRKIATCIGKHYSSVARELKRNSKNNKKYDPKKAQERYLFLRKVRKSCKCMYNNEKLVALLRKYLVEFFWSPQQISKRLELENNGIKISYQTIYRYIYNGKLDIPKWWGQRVVVKSLRRKGKKYKKNNHKIGKIIITNLLNQRPKSSELRLELGHWEADTVIGKQGKACILTLVDRKSRKVLIKKLPSKDSISVRNALIELLSNETCKSITPDRGTEFAKHPEVTMNLNIPFFFPDPHAPWQRGTNENTNGLIRCFIPKGQDISKISEERIYEIQEALNNRPRKELGYLTPNEVHSSTFSELIKV